MICLISELPIVDYSRRALCSRRCPSLGMRAMTISPSSGHIARGGKRRWYRVGRPGVRKVVLRVINLSEVRNLPSYVLNCEAENRRTLCLPMLLDEGPKIPGCRVCVKPPMSQTAVTWSRERVGLSDRLQ